MNPRILELARKAGVRDDEFRFEFPLPKYLELFYQYAHQDGQKQMRERAQRFMDDGGHESNISRLEITNE